MGEAPPIPVDEIERLIAERVDARRGKDFARADAIRAELASKGVLLEDGPRGTTWKLDKRRMAPAG